MFEGDTNKKTDEPGWVCVDQDVKPTVTGKSLHQPQFQSNRLACDIVVAHNTILMPAVTLANLSDG